MKPEPKYSISTIIFRALIDSRKEETPKKRREGFANDWKKSADTIKSYYYGQSSVFEHLSDFEDFLCYDDWYACKEERYSKAHANIINDLMEAG